MRTLAAVLAAVMLAGPAAANTTWNGHLSCGPAAWVMPRESAPRGTFVREIRLMVNGAAIRAEPRWPSPDNPRTIISERWTGSIVANSVLVLATGEATSGERWTYSFRGRWDGTNQLVLEGQQSRDGRPFRNCLLRLGTPGVR